MSGCPLEDAFNGLDPVKLKKKIKKEKKNYEKKSKIIYPEELKPVKSEIFSEDIQENILNNNYTNYAPYNPNNPQYKENQD